MSSPAETLYEKLHDASALFGVLRQEPYFSSKELSDLCSLAAAATGRCSRCEKPIKNFTAPNGGMTAGYYDAAAWKDYANDGEVYICDACMWSDKRYIAKYGEQPPGATQ